MLHSTKKTVEVIASKLKVGDKILSVTGNICEVIKNESLPNHPMWGTCVKLTQKRLVVEMPTSPHRPCEVGDIFEVAIEWNCAIDILA